MKKSLLIIACCLASFVHSQNPGLVISEFYINPPSSDSPFEWVELKATKNIDFTLTPYSVVVLNNGTATNNGWIQGGNISYGFSITTGSVLAGDVVYVGGTSMLPSGTQLRSINTGTTVGDQFGNAAIGGVFGNGGGNADGIAVFDVLISTITPGTTPVDAIFYGTGIGSAEVNGGLDGYQLPINDMYNGGKLNATSLFVSDPGAGFGTLTGTFDTLTNSWTTPRLYTIETNLSDLTSGISLVAEASASLSTDVVVVNENDGLYNLEVNIVSATASPVSIVFELSVWTDAQVGADYTIANDTLFIPANANGLFQFPISLIDDNLAENTERLIFKVKNTINAEFIGTDYQIIFIQDNDFTTPSPSNQLNLNLLTSFSNGAEGTNSAEIVSFDSTFNRLYIANSIGAKLDIVDFNNPQTPILLNSIDVTTYGNINSVVAYNGIVALAIENTNPQLNGYVVFLDENGQFINQIEIGAMPDMITYNKDYTKLLSPNEGESDADMILNPEGTISIIDLTPGIANITSANVVTIDFTAYNGQETALKAQGIRLLGNATVAQDFEPEYITISEDNTTAYVAIQESNAMAIIDIASATITDLKSFGLISYYSGNALDPSDQSGAIMIQSLPVKGATMPDAISYLNINGNGYIFTANEGDSRENNVQVDAARISTMNLDPTAYPEQNILKNNKFLGRLNGLTFSGDDNNDGAFEDIHILGGRSFSVYDELGNLVYNSNALIEQILANDPVFQNLFNASNGGSAASKNRSDDKGPEPEGIIATNIEGNNYVFVSLERIGGVMIFNVNNPLAPIYVGYYNNRDVATNGPDRGSEGIIIIPASQSPSGNDIVILANEVSSTLSIFEINSCLALSGANQINGDSAFCSGDSALLSYNQALNVNSQWIYNNNPIFGATNDSIYVSAPGNYNIIIDNSQFNCTDTTMNFFVTERTLPVINFNTSDTTICTYNTPFTLAAINPSNVDVLWNTGANTNTISSDTAGIYTIIATDEFACQNSASINVVLDACLGFNENQALTSIYPNPFVEELLIKTELRDAVLTIFDVFGKVVFSERMKQQELKIDTKDFQKGFYTIRLTSGNLSYTSKIIKN